MKRTLLAAFAAFLVVVFGITSVPIQTQSDGIAFAGEPPPPAVAAAPPGNALPEISVVDQNLPYHEAYAREGLSESECVGRLIWFKATAGNDHFHTYI